MRTTLDRDALAELSLRLEATGGQDSIPTIEEKYLRTRDGDPSAALLCCYSRESTMGQHDCQMRRLDPTSMWLHVHFTGHGPSWVGCVSPEEVVAALDAGTLQATPMERVR